MLFRVTTPSRAMTISAASAILPGREIPTPVLSPPVSPLAVIWMQLDETRREGVVDKTKADQAGGWARLAAGLASVIAGVLVMLSGSGSWEQTWLALLASVAVLGGVVPVLLPWELKFWRDLETERAGHSREAERAEIAAHLHDSVLQTLVPIQRRAGNEQDVSGSPGPRNVNSGAGCSRTRVRKRASLRTASRQ